MIAWRESSMKALAPLLTRASTLTSASKALRADASRVIKSITGQASELNEALEKGIEERADAIWEALVKEIGEEEAEELRDTADYPATAREDEQDQKAAAHLYNVDAPGVEDYMDQAIESLEGLHHGIKELLVHIRQLK